MTDLVPPEQPYYMGDNNGCLTQLLHLFGDIAIIAAMGLFVPSGRARPNQPKQKVESVKQDSIATPRDTTLVMTPNGSVFDNRTKQIIIDAKKDYSKALASIQQTYSDNLTRIK